MCSKSLIYVFLIRYTERNLIEIFYRMSIQIIG